MLPVVFAHQLKAQVEARARAAARGAVVVVRTCFCDVGQRHRVDLVGLAAADWVPFPVARDGHRVSTRDWPPVGHARTGPDQVPKGMR